MLTKDLIKLNNLQLAGKIVSEELMLGIHGSRRTGAGVEFEQYKNYLPGDDLKRIDWKFYGKTGKLLVKESATESNFHLNLVLDLSGSMNYTENEVSRLDYCKVLLASLGYLGHRQGDPMSLYSLKNGKLQNMVEVGKNNISSLLYQLETAKATGEWSNTEAKFPAFQTKRKELFIFATDFLQVNSEWLDFIRNIASPRRQIAIFQVLGDQELNFNLNGFYRFKDLETGKEMELNAQTIAKEFKASATAYFEYLDQELQIANVHLFRVSMNQPIAEVMTRALKTLRI